MCRVWRAQRSTLYWQRQSKAGPADASVQPGPPGPGSDAELVQHLKAILAESPFHGEGYRQVWARLRSAGIRTSKRRVLRLLRENQLLAPPRRGSSPGPKAHDSTITTTEVNKMWGTDMTTTFTAADGQVAIKLHGLDPLDTIVAALKTYVATGSLPPLTEGKPSVV